MSFNARGIINVPLLPTLSDIIEYEIIGEGSQISTNQKRESTVSWLLIGRNLRPFPDNFVLYLVLNQSLTTYSLPSRMYLPLLSLLQECLDTPLVSDSSQFPNKPHDSSPFTRLQNRDLIPGILEELLKHEKVRFFVSASSGA